MCLYCKDLDDYDRNHGHHCSEECEVTCDRCGNMTCEYDIVTVKSNEYDGEEWLCPECQEGIG